MGVWAKIIDSMTPLVPPKAAGHAGNLAMLDLYRGQCFIFGN